jgi:RNA polymerase sigma factor for flagellar operon FliA
MVLDSRLVSVKKDAPDVLARFESGLELVEAVARQVGRAVGASVELDELRSFGREGLLDAARRFDATRGVPFRAYANFRVRGAMIDGVRSISKLPRRAHERLNGLQAALRVSEGAAEDVHAPAAPGTTRAQAEQALCDHLAAMATAMAVGLIAKPARGDEGGFTPVSSDHTPEEALAQAELRELVRRTIEELPEQEALLVRRHYLEGERFDRVAHDLGLSKSWASRLHTRAVARLSKRLRGSTG